MDEQIQLHDNITDLKFTIFQIRSSVMPLSICIGIAAGFGILGNILILVVYTKFYTRSNFRYFVLSMAVVDLVSCVTTLPAEVYSQMNWYTYGYDALCKAKCFFNVFTVWGSACILHILAIDRYRKISRPLSWQIQTGRAVCLCIASICVAMLVSVPAAIFWGQQNYVYEHEGMSANVSVCGKSNRYAADDYALVYAMIVYIGAVGLMVLSVSVLNALTAKALFCDVKKNKTIKTTTANVSCDVSSIPTCVESNTRIDQMPATELSTQPDGPNAQQQRYPNVQGGGIMPKGVDGLKDKCEEIIICRSYHGKVMSNDLGARRKTVIMFILTSVFIITILVYLIISTIVASPDNVIQDLTNSSLVEVFVFWRLYFINCVINPIIYGFSDPRFRKGLKNIVTLIRKK